MRRGLFTAAVVLFLAVSAHAVMITSNRLAYVDIEKVFSEIGRVDAARNDIKELIQERQNQIEETEKAIASVRKKLSISRSLPGIPEAPVSGEKSGMVVSTAAAKGVAVSSATPVQAASETAYNSERKELEKLLDQKEKELKELMLESKKFLKSREQELKYEIMGSIYDTIEKVAMEEELTVIIDKEVILFSEDTVVDITDKVIRRMNERYK